MKELYIPRGKTLRYESLVCPSIVNDGTLIVEKDAKARHITGKGILKAGSISCRDLAAMDIEAATITTGTLTAERVCAAEVKVSNSMRVSCCLEAERVETPRLTVAVCEVGELEADKVVYLADREPNALLALLAGFFRWAWAKLRTHIPVDADYEPVQDEPEADGESTPEHEAPDDAAHHEDRNAELLEDFEFKRLAAMYRLLKPYGYGLRLVSLQEQEGERTEEPTFQSAA